MHKNGWPSASHLLSFFTFDGILNAFVDRIDNPSPGLGVYCTSTDMTIASIKRDSKGWHYQVWISFAISVALCAAGLSWMPGADIDRAFMVMGYVFCLCTAFVLAKFIRDKEAHAVDTPMWGLVVWAGFALAMTLTGWGLWRMGVPAIWKAFLLASWTYLISAVFTLSKMLRDAHEADVAEGIFPMRREAPREPLPARPAA